MFWSYEYYSGRNRGRINAVKRKDLAKKHKLDPVIGRDEEKRRVLQILTRRTKYNPN